MTQPETPTPVDGELTSHDWDQILMAACGSFSGRLAEWPHLVGALQKLGLELPVSSDGFTVRPICRALIKAREPLSAELAASRAEVERLLGGARGVLAELVGCINRSNTVYLHKGMILASEIEEYAEDLAGLVGVSLEEVASAGTEGGGE